MCSDCSSPCYECNSVQCFECVESCEECAALLCQACVNVVATRWCPCCETAPLDASVLLCTDCVEDKHEAKCEMCLEQCDGGECRRKAVMAEQLKCPVCWDDMASSRSVWQECGVHRVCTPCAAGMRPWTGCPLCRVGHFTP